jgi:oxygen-independent coproporphyrinogen-3 oxidase
MFPAMTSSNLKHIPQNKKKNRNFQKQFNLCTCDHWSLTTPPGLYLHVPFCHSKCTYCDFYSITDCNLIPDWLAALEKEAALYQDRFGVFDTLYLGGGTPSLLNPGQLASLLESLRRGFSFSPDTEATLEANPDDLTPEKLRLYGDLGINRLSVGVQSFHDRELAFLGRRHSARQALAALDAARAAGFANLSLDLIYGLPGQGLEDWEKTLEPALAFHPEHLSCYQLTYEPGTPLGRKKVQGKVVAATEEEERAFFLFTSRFLEERGYLHYEISNFARLGETGNQPNYQVIDNEESFNRRPKTEDRKPYFSQHNRKYWRHLPYLGLGPGAHSFLDGVRWWNVASVRQYCRTLARGEAPLAGREVLSPEQLRLEAFYLGLRTREGVPLKLLQDIPGWEKTLTDLQKSGLVEVRQGRAVPTRMGFLLADSLPLYFMDADMEENMTVNREHLSSWPLAPDP